MHTLLRDAATGAWLGLLVFGVGGRVVMRAIATMTDVPGAFTLGGTFTVLACGVGAGLGGAALHAIARAAAGRLAGGRAWVRLALFAALLALVTARGLNGSPTRPALLFWPLVALFAVLFARRAARRGRARPPRVDTAPRALSPL
jgi:hypothetical protein